MKALPDILNLVTQYLFNISEYIGTLNLCTCSTDR